MTSLNNFCFDDWKVVAKVSSFDRFSNKRSTGGNRVEGVKNIVGGHRKCEGGKIVEGDKSGLGA